MRTAAIAIATGFGLGYMPKAPGTFGTLLGIPLFIGMVHLPWWAYLLVLAVVIAIASWSATITAAYYCEEDCQKIVVDEVAGYATTMFLAPLTWQHALAGFIFFRIF